MSVGPDYWELEQVGAFEWWDFNDRREVTVSAEVPISKLLGRLPRKGNRYWPTLLSVDLGYRTRDGELMTSTLMPDQARELAASLVAAADLCEATDKPDEDECGHWWPCSGCKEGL